MPHQLTTLHNLYVSYLIYVRFDDLQNIPEYTAGSCMGAKSGSALPFCNRICAQPGLTADEVHKAVAYFGTTPFSWFVCENDKDQIRLLDRLGFTLLAEYPLMISDLGDLREEPYAPGVTVERIDLTQANSGTWLDLIAQSYKTDREQFGVFISYILRRARATVHFYQALYEGDPAACSMVIAHEGTILGLHYVGTLPEYRGKGLGFAVSHKPLVDFKKKGGKQSILFASAMGKPIYEQIGYKTLLNCTVYSLP